MFEFIIMFDISWIDKAVLVSIDNNNGKGTN